MADPNVSFVDYGGQATKNSGYDTGGSWFGRWWNDVTGKTAQTAASMQEAQRNRDWETMMSNTAYQRQVADMKAAGINPAMAATSGGASTPTSALGQASGSGEGVFGVLGKGFGAIASVVGKVAAAKIAKKASLARSAQEAANIGFKAAKSVELEALKFKHATALQEARMYHHPHAKVDRF